jgi:hypothetical protein
MQWKRMGSGYVDPCFLDLGTSWTWVVSFTTLSLNPRGMIPQYPLDRSGGPQSWYGRYEEVKILDPAGTRTPVFRSSSPQPVVGSQCCSLCHWHLSLFFIFGSDGPSQATLPLLGYGWSILVGNERFNVRLVKNWKFEGQGSGATEELVSSFYGFFASLTQDTLGTTVQEKNSFIGQQNILQQTAFIKDATPAIRTGFHQSNYTRTA